MNPNVTEKVVVKKIPITLAQGGQALKVNLGPQPSSGPEMCPIHDTEKNIFCMKCLEVMCFECREETHKDCPAKSLKAAFKEKDTIFEGILSEVDAV